MNIDNKLKKLGIEKKGEVSKELINEMAHNITNRLTNTFHVLQGDYNEILAKLLNCKIYYANIPEGIAKVNYINEDDAIYMDESIDVTELHEQLFHEVIHYLQVVRDNKGKMKRAGLCSFRDFSISGLGINEAIVQYMSAKLMGNKSTKINIYNLEINTISANFYPLLTNLIEQVIYMMGENQIVSSTIKADTKFEDDFYNTFEEKASKLLKNFDAILEIKNRLSTGKQDVQLLENKLVDIFKETQNMMMIVFYEKIIPKLTSLKEIDLYTEKFNGHRNIIDKSSSIVYEQSVEYIRKKFDRQTIKISKENSKNSLIAYNRRFRDLLKKIISYFYG